MAELSLNGTKPGRGGTLDALRFAAAFFVVLFHYGDDAPTPLASLSVLFERGYLATDFFLLLSGYVLGRAYGRSIEDGRTGPGEFLARRVARIWPAHAIVLIAMAGLIVAAGLIGVSPQNPQNFAFVDFIPQFFLVQAWADVGGGGWNLPSWSLSALIFCYALFPAIWLFMSKRPLWASVLAALGVIGLVDAGAWLFLQQGLYELPFHLGALRALPQFLAGMVIARWAATSPVPARWAGVGAVAAGMGVVALQFFGRFDALSVGLIAAAVLFIGSIPVGRPSRLVESAGKLSFALFVTHALAATVWFGGLHAALEGTLPPVAGWALWAGGLGFAVAVAWAFDRVIDQPVQRWIAPRLAAAFKSRRDRYPAPALSE